ncbi:hypothetical protein RGQ30_20360 [Limnobacter thiooxidans]|uniref:Uncharacterized protein n=1 Tax=Limnobacter thiooxidans TaxID=131080 RepID=A0AA86J8I0_9BURK|nr:hypothetical protein RGQ30_20360 [Limnobacter thiooxidans]
MSFFGLTLCGNLNARTYDYYSGDAAPTSGGTFGLIIVCVVLGLIIASALRSKDGRKGLGAVLGILTFLCLGAYIGVELTKEYGKMVGAASGLVVYYIGYKIFT